MHTAVETLLKELELGPAHTDGDIVVFPIMTPPRGPAYLTLAEALERRLLTVTEVSPGGAVSELRVVSTADVPVLMLDGEELAGAKQNRVLNTSVLVGAHQTLVIPVSCTEQGRWSYVSDVFCDSGIVMSCHVRARKNLSVATSLAQRGAPVSDQATVWESVAAMQEAAGVASPTGAMRDVYTARRKSLEHAVAAFPLLEGQTGLLVVIDGQPAGWDCVSQPAAYARLHGKLVASYVLDALLRPGPAGHAVAAAFLQQQARDFIAQAHACQERAFKSVGCGEDYRYRDGQIVGSALVFQDTVVHAAFFRADAEHHGGRMSGLASRRRHRLE